MKTSQQVDIEQVWEQLHRTHRDEFRNILMEHYTYLVKYAAERLYSKLPDKVELDDLISAGIFGLMDAIDAYDPGRGVKFETYCSPRIKGSILDELRSMDWVPRLVRARAHQLTRVMQSLETHLGRKPTEKETARELDMDMEEFNRLRRDANAVSVVSLDTRYSVRRDDDEGNRGDAGFVGVPRFANALVHYPTAESPDEQPEERVFNIGRDSCLVAHIRQSHKSICFREMLSGSARSVTPELTHMFEQFVEHPSCLVVIGLLPQFKILVINCLFRFFQSVYDHGCQILDKLRSTIHCRQGVVDPFSACKHACTFKQSTVCLI